MNYRWSKSTKDNELLRTCDHFVTSSHPVTLPVTTHPIVIHQITPHRDEVTRFPVLSCPRARIPICARAPYHLSRPRARTPFVGAWRFSRHVFPSPRLPPLPPLTPHSPPPSPSPRHSTPPSPPPPSLPLRPRPRIHLPLPSLAPPHFHPAPHSIAEKSNDINQVFHLTAPFLTIFPWKKEQFHIEKYYLCKTYNKYTNARVK